MNPQTIKYCKPNKTLIYNPETVTKLKPGLFYFSVSLWQLRSMTAASEAQLSAPRQQTLLNSKFSLSSFSSFLPSRIYKSRYWKEVLIRIIIEGLKRSKRRIYKWKLGIRRNWKSQFKDWSWIHSQSQYILRVRV